VKLSPAVDPVPWETRKVMKGLGFQGDCLQEIDSRLNGAAIVAVGALQRAGGTSIVAAPGFI
jgi:hypothetical protein